MKVIIQRVSSASVTIHENIKSSINKGMLVLLGIHINDTQNNSDYIINKLLKLRIFADSKGLMNKNILEINGEILLVSQFTLYGDCNNGNRPSFSKAMPSKEAGKFYKNFVETLRQKFPKLQTGEFAANMQVELINDGPITIEISSN